MKKEIVYTDKYALILSDDGIKEGDWIKLDGKCLKAVDTSYLPTTKKIIAHLPLSDAPILEGVPLLPPLPQGDDIKELAEENYPIGDCWNSEQSLIRKLAFKNGYNKAKEKYKFTEEDMINFAIWKSITVFNTPYTPLGEFRLWESLQQPSRPTHFECEIDNILSFNWDDGIDAIVNDNFGNPKTTTNSQGQIELVGKYSNQ